MNRREAAQAQGWMGPEERQEGNEHHCRADVGEGQPGQPLRRATVSPSAHSVRAAAGVVWKV